MIAYVFPGQGSQAVGMGKDLAAAEPSVESFFDRANEILGRDLKRIIFEGPEEALKETSNTQPALFVVSMAALEMMRQKGWQAQADFYAGHSLGEYSALCAAGVFGFEDGLRLVQERADAMTEAALSQPGAMAAVLGMEDAAVSEACKKAAAEGPWVQPANYNSPGQVVISGERSGVERAMELCREAGALKCVPLAVSGAFHSRIMEPAGERLRRAFGGVAWHAPSKPVVSNADGRIYGDIDSIQNGLVRQISEPVLWTACMRALLSSGVAQFVEVGPGKVLQGLMKKIDRKAVCCGAGDMDSITKGPSWSKN